MESISAGDSKRQTIAAHHAYLGVLTSIVAFQIVKKIVAASDVPKFVKCDQWKYKNLCVSWIHSVTTGCWDLACIVLYPELILNPIKAYNTFSYTMVALSTGYFIHDFIDICRHRVIKGHWEVLLHHIAVTSMFFYNLVTCQCIGYTVIALAAEVNSMFLHSRKLLQMRQVEFHSPLYRINVWVNLGTFVVGRFVSNLAIILGMIFLNDQVSPTYMVCLTASMIVMCPINVVLFLRLVKNDVVRFYKNIYHNKYQLPNSPSSTSVTDGATSNNNMSKASGNGHIKPNGAGGILNGIYSNHNSDKKVN